MPMLKLEQKFSRLLPSQHKEAMMENYLKGLRILNFR